MILIGADQIIYYFYVFIYLFIIIILKYFTLFLPRLQIIV